MCTCLGLTTWERITHQAHPWRRLILPLSVSINCLPVAFHQGRGLVRLPPFPLVCQLVLVVCSKYFEICLLNMLTLVS